MSAVVFIFPETTLLLFNYLKRERTSMTTRAKVTLTPEQETLLITLYAKAQPGNPLFFDPMAQDILNRVDYDFARLRVPYKTVVLVCQRAKKLDAVTRDFLAEHPGGVVLQLGCGLDSRFWRVDDGRVNWYDLDMPPVVELRHQFFTESERYHMIAASVTDLEWAAWTALGYGPHAVVLEPEELRCLVSERARAIVAQYACA